MATFERFEEIEAWHKARALTNELYRITRRGAFSRDFGLRDQVRRAGVSIMSNIAEGFERGGSAEFRQFLWIAKGSAGEVASQLYVAVDQDYIDRETFDRLYALSGETGRMIGGLARYLHRTDIRGTKHKPSEQ